MVSNLAVAERELGNRHHGGTVVVFVFNRNIPRSANGEKRPAYANRPPVVEAELSEAEATLYRQAKPLLETDRGRAHHHDPAYWQWLLEQHERDKVEAAQQAIRDQQRVVAEANIFEWWQGWSGYNEVLDDAAKAEAYRVFRCYRSWYPVDPLQPIAPQIAAWRVKAAEHNATMRPWSSHSNYGSITQAQYDAIFANKDTVSEVVVVGPHGAITQAQYDAIFANPDTIQGGQFGVAQRQSKSKVKITDEVIEQWKAEVKTSSLRVVAKRLTEGGFKISHTGLKKLLDKRSRKPA
jgi:hypothetical protein